MNKTPIEPATPDFLASVIHERLISMDLDIDTIRAAAVAGDCLGVVRQLQALQECVTDTSKITEALCDMLEEVKP